MGRPGMMIYFDMLGPISVLTNTERGKLLTAMLEYGKEGKTPDFRGKLALAWGFVQPKIDRDEESYDSCVLKRKYASFCSKLTAKNISKIDYDEWLAMDEQQRRHMLAGADNAQQVAAYADTREPTTITNPTAISTANTKTNTYTSVSADADAEEDEDASLEAAAATQRKKMKKWEGELGKGVVMMTEEQFENLLDKMDLDGVEHYIPKLADFILKNNAQVKNHYQTLLRWWEQDRLC